MREVQHLLHFVEDWTWLIDDEWEELGRAHISVRQQCWDGASRSVVARNNVESADTSGGNRAPLRESAASKQLRTDQL